MSGYIKIPPSTLIHIKGEYFMSTTILRRPEVALRIGIKPHTTHSFIARGILTKPISVGLRARGWPSTDIDAIVKARCAGATEDQIKALVIKLTDSRQFSA